MSKLKFNSKWYNNLVNASNEKEKILEKIQHIIREDHSSLLDIGIGTSSFFIDRLSKSFKEITIVEKESIDFKLPKNSSIIQNDWEETTLTHQFDVALASHVVYYFEDKASSIKKIQKSLTPNGFAIYVVNGKDGNYGELKTKFSKIIGKDYSFTYDELKEILGQFKYTEYSIESHVEFKSSEDLYEKLRLSFDHYVDEYNSHKEEIIEYFNESLKGKNKFIINQKLFAVQNSPWFQLLNHINHDLQIKNLNLEIKENVFSPNPEITHSTSILLDNFPNVKNTTVLDIGCGTGILGIHALKQKASKVVFSDINQEAINNTLINIQKNHNNQNFNLIKSNLFESIDEKFDHILANLPISEDEWEGISTQKNLEEFLIKCKEYLKPNGTVHFTWASFSELEPVEEILSTLKYQYDLITVHQKETDWHLFKIQTQS